MEELLKEVNGEVRLILAEALAHGENPRLVALLRSVVKLTNSSEDNADDATETAKAAAVASQKAKLAAQMADLQKQMASL